MDGAADFKVLEKNDESSNVNTLVANEFSSQLHLPGGNLYLSADFVREGYDLTLKTADGQTTVLPDYFMKDTPPDLVLDDGSILTADLVSKLAGPMVPGQVAQLQADPQTQVQSTLGAAIGSVSELQGNVLATRADGTQVTLTAGDPIYQGDVLETGAKSALGVIFADDTSFSLDADGRMVMDEMVYDPDAQTGVLEATVVKGVFSFVSGQVAKTDADAMVINTPKTTIGIRGSTGLIKSGADDGEDQITLVPDIDGNLGELVVSNQAGSQVLNQPNASTSVFSATQPPTPVVLMNAQQIQQNYGGALTVLVRTEAKKAVAKVEHAARQAQEAADKATQQKGEADKAKDEADQAEETAAEAQAEADAAQAEAEAAKAEAEAITDVDAKAAAEAKAAAAEAKALEAQAKAAFEAEAAAAKVAEATAKAEAAILAEQQAQVAVAVQQAAQQFSQMAGSAAEIQQQVFTKFMETGIVDPGFMPGAPAPGFQPGGPNGPGPDGNQNGNQDGGPEGGLDAEESAAAEAAYQAAIEAGATPEEAFNAAALAATGGNLDDPGVDAARAAFQDALANGASPEEAMKAAEAAVRAQEFNDIAQNMPPQGSFSGPGQGMIYISPTGEAFTLSPNGQVIVVSQNGSSSSGTDLSTNFVNAGSYYEEVFSQTYNSYVETTATVVTTETGETTTVTTDDDYVNTDFAETKTAVNGGGALSGGSGNTNFYFPWASLESGAGGTYTITDTGGTNQLSFDGMNDVQFFVTASTSTSGSITVYKTPNGTPTTFGTISYSNISQFLLSDVTVSSFSTNNFTTTASGDVLKLSGLDAGDSGYGLAGTSGNDTMTLSSSHGSIVFGKDGNDAFTITATGSVQILGGAGDDTYNVNAWGSADGGHKLTGGDGADHYNYSGWTSPPSLYAYFSSSGSVVQDVTYNSTSTYKHALDMTSSDTFTGGTGNDFIYITSGTVGTINGSDGNDTISVSSGATVTSVTGGTGSNTLTVYQGGSIGGYTGGTGDDSVIIDSALLANAITIDGGTNATTDNLTIKAYAGASVNLNTITATLSNFENTTVTGVESTAAVTFTGYNGLVTTLVGSALGDSLTGGSAADTLQGQGGNDELTGGMGADQLSGGSGADKFIYNGTTQGGDSISDFISGTDQFNFQSPAFNGANVSGTLDSTNFISGANAVAGDGNDYFAYDSTAQTLYYDDDGSGANARVAIATFATDVGLQSTDIVMIS